MSRWGLRVLFVVVFIGMLAFAAYQLAAPSKTGDTPVEIPVTAQQEKQAVQPEQPAIWYGLVASLVGAVVLWISVLFMARRSASSR